MKLAENIRKTPDLHPYRLTKYSSQHGKVSLPMERTLELVCLGYSNKEIAEMTYFSEAAIKDHVKRLLGIYHARTRTHLAVLVVAEVFR